MSEETLATLNPIGQNEANLKDLSVQIGQGGIIPFVGAGLSANDFPVWGAFLVALARDVENSLHITGLAGHVIAHIQEGQFEEAADELCSQLGHRAFNDAIERTYGAEPSRALSGPASFLPDIVDRGPVLTTNFDRVLAVVFQQAGIPFHFVMAGPNAAAAARATQGAHALIQIHGDAVDSDHRVLTSSDYDKVYGRLLGGLDISLPLPSVLRLLVQGRPILFLGCSLQKDRTLTVLARAVEEWRSLAHYAIVEMPASNEQLAPRN